MRFMRKIHKYYVFVIAFIATMLIIYKIDCKDYLFGKHLVMEEKRLSRSIMPTHYNLNFTVDTVNFVFEGRSLINLNVIKPSKHVTLNMKDIRIKNVKLIKNNVFIKPKTIETSEENETVKLTFNDFICDDTDLYIEFDGEIKDILSGLYRCSYIDNNKTKRYITATHFEPIDARRLFPSFDEPDFKSTFDVTVITNEPNIALSNMNLNTSRVFGNGMVEYVFNRTPKMSTYLLAIVVGEFDHIEKSFGKRNTPLRIYVPCGTGQLTLGMGDFALDIGVKVLEFFEDYFDVEYPLPKMDMVSVPDFAVGAMENWGLITYRESSLLFNEKQSSISRKRNVAYIVAHELAHQWFGNLVTMYWWSDLWLNEGFATWAGYLAVAYCFPDLKIWKYFVKGSMSNALGSDASIYTKPIHVDGLLDRTNIHSIFDGVSYDKGASLIRMISSYLSPSVLKDGLRHYIKTYMYKNAKADDLWSSLEFVSKEPVKNMMNMWISMQGFPIISVDSEAYDEENKQLTLSLSQERYLFLCHKDSTDMYYAQKWEIPLNIKLSYRNYTGFDFTKDCNENGEEYIDSSVLMNFLLTEKNQKFVIDGVDPDYRYKLNSENIGFYTTKYTSNLFEHAMNLFLDEHLSLRDSIGFLNDLFLSLSHGCISVTVVLELLLNYYLKLYYKHIRHYPDHSVLFTLIENLIYLKSAWVNLRQELMYIDIFNTIIDVFYLPLSESLGLNRLCSRKDGTLEFSRPADDDNTMLIRSSTLSGLVHNDSTYFIEQCNTIFESSYIFNERKNSTDVAPNIDPDLTQSIFISAMKINGTNNYDRMFRIYKESQIPDARTNALVSLTFSNDPLHINRTLELVLNENEIKTQDLPYVFCGYCDIRNHNNRMINDSGQQEGIVWNFIKKYWDDNLYPRMVESPHILTCILSSSINTLYSEQEMKDVQMFFSVRDVSLFRETLLRSLEKRHTFISRFEKDTEKVNDWLKKHKDSWVNNNLQQIFIGHTQG